MGVAERDQTVAEEIMNALSHGLGLLLAIASLPRARRRWWVPASSRAR